MELFRRFYPNKIILIACLFVASFVLTACDDGPEETEVKITKIASAENRSNEPKCLTPVAAGQEILGDNELTLDITNRNDGYLYVNSTGEIDDINM